MPKHKSKSTGSKPSLNSESTDNQNERWLTSTKPDDHPPEENEEPAAVQQNTQNPTERREIRHKYRQLINDTKVEQETGIISSESDKYDRCLKDANELFKKVTTAREAALDSELLYLCAKLGKEKIQSLNTDFIKFQPIEFAEKLVTVLSGGRMSADIQDDDSPIPLEGWEKLGKTCAPLFNKSPTLDFMLGTFSMESIPKPTKAPLRRKRHENDNCEETSPDNVEDGQVESTTEEVERVLSVLHHVYKRNDAQPLCYFEFVVNPHSFGYTIENMFHVSFLVKDGFAEIFLDADKLPCIVPVLERDEDLSQPQKKRQVVMSITKAEWKEIIEVFKIEQAVIPPKSKKSGKTPQKKVKK
ncbi:Non-structural maintenance of chromosomes element 4 A [Nymphon striatum]|nr:Non-structural maintenance of chromosomes element 4 A [Nymphon striatum]